MDRARSRPVTDVTGNEWESHWSDFYEASQVNPAGAYRLRILLRWLDTNVRPGFRLLDVGSGVGDLATAADRRYPTATVRGIELSARGVEIARHRAPRAEFLQRDLLLPARPPSSWSNWADVAVCSEVLEHVDEPRLLLSNARQFLAAGCRVLVTVPGGPMSAFDRHIGHRRHYTRRDLRALLTSSGFEVGWCGGLGFPFFNLYRLLVVARGETLVREAASGQTTTGRSARMAGAVFDHLFRLNPRWRRAGWQMAAEARLADPVTAANRSDVQ